MAIIVNAPTQEMAIQLNKVEDALDSFKADWDKERAELKSMIEELRPLLEALKEKTGVA